MNSEARILQGWASLRIGTEGVLARLSMGNRHGFNEAEVRRLLTETDAAIRRSRSAGILSAHKAAEIIAKIQEFIARLNAILGARGGGAGGRRKRRSSRKTSKRTGRNTRRN